MRLTLTLLMAASSIGCATPRTPFADSRGPRAAWDRAAEWFVGPEPRAVATPWSPLLPVGGIRADLLPASVSADRLAAISPPSSAIQLVGAESGGAKAELLAIGEARIAHYGDFRTWASRLEKPADQSCIVRLAGAERRLVLPSGGIRSLEDSLLPEGKTVRVSEDGVEWLMERSGDIVARASLRVNPAKGLGQLILSLRKCSGDDDALPHNIVVAQSNEPCRCLKASDVLERLYGEPKPTPRPNTDGSFAAVSEGEDYLALPNYRRLEERHLGKKTKMYEATHPMLGGLPGVPYPGPAILADARAVTAFLLRKEKLHARDGERTGWMFFELSPTHRGEPIRVSVELGAKPIVFEFKQLQD